MKKPIPNDSRASVLDCGSPLPLSIVGPHRGGYGAREVGIPILDQLAAAGARYTRCFTTAPVRSPSRSAFMTGMYQTTIGAHDPRSHRDDGYELPKNARVRRDWLHRRCREKDTGRKGGWSCPGLMDTLGGGDKTCGHHGFGEHR